MARTLLFNPVPKLDHDEVDVVHLAIRFPAFVKSPPAYILFDKSAARTMTVLLFPNPPILDVYHDEVDGVHLAIAWAESPPAVLKYPPIYTF
jgi:hypothetical protein